MLHTRRIRRRLGEAAALILLAWIASASAQEPAYGTAATEIAERISAASTAAKSRTSVCT